MKKRTPQQVGRLSRAKGHQFERDCCKMLTDATGIEHKRVLIETREGNSGDIDSGATGRFQYQCKVGANPPIYDAVRQAEMVAGGCELPVALIRRNAAPGRRRSDLAVMPLWVYLRLLEDRAAYE